MNNQLIILQICRTLADLDEESLRAVYMIVQRLQLLQPPKNNIS